MKLQALLATWLTALVATEAQSIVSQNGDTIAIPKWSLTSTRNTTTDPLQLSQPGVDVSSWYSLGSKGTVMSGLLQAGVFTDDNLFYSDNLEKKTKRADYTVPWLYRHEFELQPQLYHFYFLETHGIASRADVFVNGQLVANKTQLVGAYGGKKLDITNFVRIGANAVLVRAYPTNYLRDFALGFVDWNPYPPDNGTGIWRDIQVSQTGPVSIEAPRITTDYNGETSESVKVTVKVELVNNGGEPLSGTVDGVIKQAGGGALKIPITSNYSLDANEGKTVLLTATIKDAKVWWPRQWGAQPLYTVDVAATLFGEEISDRAETRTFGIRHVTSSVNAHNDTAFAVNGQNFQVKGAGYSSDMFLRFDEAKLRTQFEYVLGMGLNTVRLEGKQEHPYLYDLADQLGLMILPGWECCDKWEGWSYNDEADGVKWKDVDYRTAQAQVRHEGKMLQGHASILGFLVGSDFWPDERASKIYVDTLRELDFGNPIIASAAKRGYPTNLGPSGMKMDGPYDWVPPNYWYGDKLGAAFGFGSELGAGVGTPELPSLKKFLSAQDLADLWKPESRDKSLYHMSNRGSQFSNRSIYNAALSARYGEPRSLRDYLWKAQMSDYEATRAEYEAYAAKKDAARPATGVIYWMLNNAWPSLHWNLFDYYLAPAGSYHGVAVGARAEHVAYDYAGQLWLINQKLGVSGPRTIEISVLSLTGKELLSRTIKTTTQPNTSKAVGKIAELLHLKQTSLLRLGLRDAQGQTLSRNVYWLGTRTDRLDWSNSTWYYTPVTTYTDYTAMQHLTPVTVSAKQIGHVQSDADKARQATIELVNQSRKTPAVFVRATLADATTGQQVLPVQWQDNYVTLWPGEKTRLRVRWRGTCASTVQVAGYNSAGGSQVRIACS